MGYFTTETKKRGMFLKNTLRFCGEKRNRKPDFSKKLANGRGGGIYAFRLPLSPLKQPVLFFM